jgi:hypothetical protein
MKTTIDHFSLADLEERAFFIHNSETRKKVKNMCAYSHSVNCSTFAELKPGFKQMGLLTEDTDFAEKMDTGVYNDLIISIFKKTLWSESEVKIVQKDKS